jgi:hypothetical protein
MASFRPPHSKFAAEVISPHVPPPYVVRCLLLSVARTHLRLLLFAPTVPAAAHPPVPLAPAPSNTPPASAATRGAVVASCRSPTEPRAPMSATHAGGACSLRPESTGPDFPFHMFQMYVSSVSEVCCRCFIWMLQIVDRDVAYVASVSETYCKHLFKIFHLFETYVAKHFLYGCCTCFIPMLQEYV